MRQISLKYSNVLANFYTKTFVSLVEGLKNKEGWTVFSIFMYLPL